MNLGPPLPVIEVDRYRDYHPPYYIDFPLPRARGTLIDRLAAVHVGREIPANMMLLPGGSEQWKAELTDQNDALVVKIPQIYSFATAGWVIPFDTCSRWNASSVTFIFSLPQILAAGIANVGPELMFLKATPIPVTLVNKDLIPEDHALIRANKSKTKFVFYSGGKQETSLALRREITNKLMAELGFLHFEPMNQRFPIPCYDMLFYLNNLVKNYVEVFESIIFKGGVSFGWELFSISGGADLFYRYQGILRQGSVRQCVHSTSFNLNNLHKRIQEHLLSILHNDTATYQKIESLLNDAEKLLQTTRPADTDFSRRTVQETLFYQWLEIFKNMSYQGYETYRKDFIEHFLVPIRNEACAVERTLLSNMRSIFCLVKHIERVSPFLKRQLANILNLPPPSTCYQLGMISVSPYLWKQFYKFYYCAPLDEEKISAQDLQAFKHELKISFNSQGEEIYISHLDDENKDLNTLFSSLVIETVTTKKSKLSLHQFHRYRISNNDRERWISSVCNGNFEHIASLDEDGIQTAMERAAPAGKKEVVQELLKYVPPTCSNCILTLAFRYAVQRGFYEIAIMLLLAAPQHIHQYEKREAFLIAIEKNVFELLDAMRLQPETLNQISRFTIFCAIDDALAAQQFYKVAQLMSMAQACLNTHELGVVLVQMGHDNHYEIIQAYLSTQRKQISVSSKQQIREVMESKTPHAKATNIINMLKTDNQNDSSHLEKRNSLARA